MTAVCFPDFHYSVHSERLFANTRQFPAQYSAPRFTSRGRFRLKCTSQPLTEEEVTARELKIGNLVETARDAIFGAINADATSRNAKVQVCFSIFKTVLNIRTYQKVSQNAKEITRKCKQEFEDLLASLRVDPDPKRFTDVDQGMGYLVRRTEGQLEHMCNKYGEPL